MKLTQRGVGAILLAGLAILMAATFGPRSLNAVAAPLLGAVFVGAVLVWRADPPTVEASPVAAGFPGETRSLRLDVDGSGVCRVVHEWPDGLEGEPLDAVLALPATLEADLTYVDRGVYDVGLDQVRRRDPLGLVESTASVDGATTAVVFPALYRVSNRSALAGLFADEALVERQEFDSLREYEPGDPLRHVHWKSSAKHDEFLVTEFSPNRRTETVVIAGEATPGCADAMAEAVGTVAMVALRAGLSVGLSLPERRLAPGTGETHTTNLLRALARADHGQVTDAERAEADITIAAQQRETIVRVGDGSLMFGDLLAESPTEQSREVLAR
jgi:uncharacterized protein (DUF58 family)